MIEDDDHENSIEAYENAVEFMREELESHAEHYLKTILNLGAFSSGIESEIARLTAMKKSKDALSSKIKSAILSAMKSCKVTSIQTSVGKISVKAGSIRTVVYDESLLPDDCMATKVTIKPILKEVKKLIQEDKIQKSVADIVRGDDSLSIK
jgi:hypothetical protein